MSNDETKESVDAGSSETNTEPKDPAENAGQSKGDEQKVDWEKNYKELEKKLGTQGQELGEYKQYITNLTPLLSKLEGQPELIQAILDGKIDSNLAKSVSEGKISIDQAEEITEAHKEVKKEMGKKEYDKADPEDLMKKVEAKLEEKFSKITTEVDKKLSDAEELKNYEEGVNSFIASHKDFPDYAEEVSKWFEKNPNKTDISEAYNAVKVEKLEAKEKEEEEKKAAEAAKNLVPKGGGSLTKESPQYQDAVKNLFGNSFNPNNF